MTIYFAKVVQLVYIRRLCLGTLQRVCTYVYTIMIVQASHKFATAMQGYNNHATRFHMLEHIYVAYIITNHLMKHEHLQLLYD